MIELHLIWAVVAVLVALIAGHTAQRIAMLVIEARVRLFRQALDFVRARWPAPAPDRPPGAQSPPERRARRPGAVWPDR